MKRFDPPTDFIGRNGMFSCIGIEITPTDSHGRRTIMLEPLTTKGVTGRALLEIPVSAVPEFIAELQKVAAENKQKPVDLNTCVPGQRLLSKHGWILTYVGKANLGRHTVKYPDGVLASRTDDGYVSSMPEDRREQDHDIVEIL